MDRGVATVAKFDDVVEPLTTHTLVGAVVELKVLLAAAHVAPALA